MEYGESPCDPARSNPPRLTGPEVRRWDNIEMSLWRIKPVRSEIFPPSRGSIRISRDTVYMEKPRAVRQVIPMVAQGYPMVDTAGVPTVVEGVQWWAFSSESIRKVAMTMLLKPKVVVSDATGTWEVIMGREGKESIDAIQHERESHNGTS